MNNLNPDFIINQMLIKYNLVDNEMANNAVNVYRQGNSQELNQILHNICKEKKQNADYMINIFKQQYGIN